MQELTLTGATLLGSTRNNPNNNTNTNSRQTEATTTTTTTTSCNDPNHHHLDHHHHHPTSNNSLILNSPSSSQHQPIVSSRHHPNHVGHSYNNTGNDHHHPTGHHQHHHHATTIVSTAAPTTDYKKIAKDVVTTYKQQQQPTGPTMTTTTTRPNTNNDNTSDDNEIYYNTITNVVKMGPYELFIELIGLWKDQFMNNNNNNTTTTNENDAMTQISKIILQSPPEHDLYSITHWATKRYDDIRFVQYLYEQLPYSAVSSSNNTTTTTAAVQVPPTIFHRASKDSTGMTPFHWACTVPNNLPMINYILTSTTTALASNSNGTTTSLLEVRDGAGCTGLLLAAQYGHVEMVAYLLQKGASLLAVDTNYDTAMHWAAYKGSQAVVGLLCYYNRALLVQPDTYGQTPIHLAALRGHTTCVRYIVQQLIQYDTIIANGTDGSLNNNTGRNNASTSIASNYHPYRTIKEVLYYKDKNGRTPYELAVHKEKQTIAYILQQYQETIGRYEIMKRNPQSRIVSLLTYTIPKTMREFVTVRAWKRWLGIVTPTPNEEYDDENAPLFPLYYVYCNIIVHLFYQITVFLPIISITGTKRIGDGVLWDSVGIIFTTFVIAFLTVYLLYTTTHTNPGTLSLSTSSSIGATTTITTNQSEVNITYWKRKYEEILESMANPNSTNNTTNNPEQHYTLCHTCHVARPHRSKHCKYTKSCIVVYDHHCPFVGTTVGLYNYKYFYGFVVGLSLYFVLFYYLLILYILRKHTHHALQHEYVTVTIGIVLGLHGIFPITMIIYHTQLIYWNLTTNEHIQPSKYNYLWRTKLGGAGGGVGSTATAAIAQASKEFYNPYDHGFMQNFMNRVLFPNESSYLLGESTTAGPIGRTTTTNDEHQSLLSNNNLHHNITNNNIISSTIMTGSDDDTSWKRGTTTSTTKKNIIGSINNNNNSSVSSSTKGRLNVSYRNTSTNKLETVV